MNVSELPGPVAVRRSLASPHAAPCHRRTLLRAHIVGIASLFACTPSDPTDRALRPLSEDPTFAVVLSDRTSTAIALLDVDGEVIDSAWIHSGSALPGLNAALSGDVVLPSSPGPKGQLTLLDRYRSDVITRFDLRSGTLIGQLRLRTPEESEPSFSSNPQDLVFVDPRAPSAWVTRFGIALAPPDANAGVNTGRSGELGNDIVEVDTERMVLTGRRRTLSAFNTLVDTRAVYARPSALVAQEGAIVVGLSRLSLAFDTAADGVIAIFSPTPYTSSSGDTGSTSNAEDVAPISARPLEGLANCGQVTRVPGTRNEVLVSCVGFSHPFGDAVQVRATSGFGIFMAANGTLTAMSTWRAADHANAPNPTASAIAIAPNLVVGIEPGQSPATPDTLYVIDLSSDEAHALVHSMHAYELGTPAFDPATGLLLVPDASRGIHRFRFNEGQRAFTELPRLDLGVRDGLPPREVRRIAPE
ncbi:MAG: hypothetical protein IPK13_08865 [Deltaproteobacteria bacterium]|nr:hypothetical protein [Deltaproteobacteria bacterium]